MTRAARGVRRQVVMAGGTQRAEVRGVLEGRVEGFAQTADNWKWSKREETTKVNWWERVAFTRRRGVFMGM